MSKEFDRRNFLKLMSLAGAGVLMHTPMAQAWLGAASRRSSLVASTLTLSPLLFSGASLTDQTTHTFSSQNFGTASADRLIILGLSVCHTALPSISSVSIGGVGATQLVLTSGADASSGYHSISFYSAVVPAGTTGNISVVFSAATGNVYVQGWSLKNYQSATPVSTSAVIATGTTTAQINLKKGGCCLAIGLNPLETTAFTISGVNSELNLNDTSNRRGAGSLGLVASYDNYPIRFIGDGTRSTSVAAVSFR